MLLISQVNTLHNHVIHLGITKTTARTFRQSKQKACFLSGFLPLCALVTAPSEASEAAEEGGSEALK